MERERVAAELRQALMAASLIPVSDEPQPAFVGPPAPATLMTVTFPIATMLPRFAGSRDVQTQEEFFSEVDNFRLINGIPTEDRVRRVFTAALDGSAKLCIASPDPSPRGMTLSQLFVGNSRRPTKRSV